MKCNNFDAVIKRLKTAEKDQLIAAVKAHGGSYHFNPDDDSVEKPIITFDTSDEFEGAQDVEIHDVYINENGKLVLSGRPTDDVTDIDGLDPDDVAAGHLHYVTEYMDAAGEVDDVSQSVEEILKDVLSEEN